ncbi:heavy metal translocating P-type ATPase [Chitinimonas sp. JJ19]|uniref:heavy metal translocating P-type ATPase n=1 Tax=Chitinimonas sp. JJ19 TaxID=3109352 RepID=UPI003001BA45
MAPLVGITEPSPVSTMVPAGCVRSQLRIAQMDCPVEEALIRKKLGGMAAVQGLEFNLIQRVLTVVHAPGALPAIEAAILSLGMTAEGITDSAAPAAAVAPSKPWWPLAVSGGLALGAEIAHWLQGPEWVSAVMALAAIALCGIGTYKKGWIALRNGELNINALMTIAVTGAILIRQWPEAAMVMFLFTIAELIEAKSLDRARNAIRGLMQLTPERATMLQADGRWLEVEAKAVPLGAVVRIKPGERIGLDGVLVSGGSTVNQAPITGESIPVDKVVGDTIFAGTINIAGSFEYRVTAAASNSTLARIIHAIEEAQGARAPTQRFVDRFARIYTPLVFVLALAVALLPPLLMEGDWYAWVYKALVLLVIACPCALVISTPVTIVSGLAAAARHGILVKGGVYLEEGRRLKWLALDKTGTITHGKPELVDSVILDESVNAMQLATSLAVRSDHPVSHAIARAGKQSNVAVLPVADFSALLGRGVRGQVAGELLHLGNHRLIEELGVCSPDLEQHLFALEEAGKTVILLASERKVLALFAVADTVKDSSREAVKALHALGIRTVMLTGDNQHTAAAIARQVGMDEARGNQLPEDKLKAIEAFAQMGKVGMVGDGINDAPALARADIGFAMGAAGTDTAIETADVALMDDDLRKIARFVQLSRSTHAVLVQNISLALGIKAVFLALTLMGLGTMWMAVFADMGAALLVVGNGLRLLRK